MPKISPLAAVDPQAQLGDQVEIGPFCIVGPHVVIGDGTRLIAHVTLLGHTTIGRKNVFFPNSVIGTAPQDLKYKGGPTRVEIGNDNHFREQVTVHAGTEVGVGVTRIGNNNLLMVNCHIGHDAQFGSRCILANNVMIAGHVHCGDGVAMMGGVGVHHFASIGDFAYIAGYSQIHHDVPPFVKLDGADRVRALNSTGLKRNGFSAEDIAALEDATRQLFFGRKRPFAVVMAAFEADPNLNRYVRQMIDFLHRRNQGRHGRYLEGLREK